MPRINKDRVEGWKIVAFEAIWRCWATESARRCRASTLSSSVTAGLVVNVGRESRRLESAGSMLVMAPSCSPVRKEPWASGEGKGAGKAPVEEAILIGRRQSGVLAKEGGAESDSRTRFALKVVRNAAIQSYVSFERIGC